MWCSHFKRCVWLTTGVSIIGLSVPEERVVPVAVKYLQKTAMETPNSSLGFSEGCFRRPGDPFVLLQVGGCTNCFLFAAFKEFIIKQTLSIKCWG